MVYLTNASAFVVLQLMLNRSGTLSFISSKKHSRMRAKSHRLVIRLRDSSGLSNKFGGRNGVTRLPALQCRSLSSSSHLSFCPSFKHAHSWQCAYYGKDSVQATSNHTILLYHSVYRRHAIKAEATDIQRSYPYLTNASE